MQLIAIMGSSALQFYSKLYFAEYVRKLSVLGEQMNKDGSTMEKIKICDSLCAWIDLLGYGSAFYLSGWDLHNPIAYRNIERIQKLEPITTSVRTPLNETLFTLNDGFIRNYDIGMSGIQDILGWLIDVLLKFKSINEFDINNGFYGARGVITYGNRAQYRKFDSVGMGDLIMTSEPKRQKYNSNRVGIK